MMNQNEESTDAHQDWLYKESPWDPKNGRFGNCNMCGLNLDEYEGQCPECIEPDEDEEE